MNKKALLFTSIGTVFAVGVATVTLSGVNQVTKITNAKENPYYQIQSFTETHTTQDSSSGNLSVTFSGKTEVYNETFVSVSSFVSCYGNLTVTYPDKEKGETFIAKYNDTESMSFFNEFYIAFWFEAPGTPIESECKVSYRSFDYNGNTSGYKTVSFEIAEDDGLYLMEADVSQYSLLQNTYSLEISSIAIVYSCNP